MRKFTPPLLVLIFLLSAFSISAKETSWTIEFKKGTLSGQGLSTSNKSTTYISSGDKIVSSVSSATNCYYGESGGLRVGKSATGDSNLGNFKLNIAADYQVVPTKIVVKASASANGTSHSFTVSGFGTQTLTTGNETSYTINAATSDKLTTLSVSNAKTNRGMLYIASVTVYYDDGTGGGDDPQPVTVPAPTFKVNGADPTTDEYEAGAKVTIDYDENTLVTYTLDGTDPTNDSEMYAGEEIIIEKTTTVKAIAFGDGDAVSEIREITVKIAKPKAPEFTVEGTAVAGYYTDGATVTISQADGAPFIYYTLDGTEPTGDSTPYEDAITLDKTTTIKAIAFDEYINASDVSEITIKVGEPPMSHETTYTFDFSKKDFGANTVYGLAVHSGSNDNTYEKNTSIIERKGVKLTITPPSSGNAHRIWETNGATDLRMYLSSMTFSVPEGGFIKSVEFTKSGSGWTAPKINDTATTLSGLKWTAADDVNSVKFTFTAKSFIKGITVTYDLGKPAPPCIVTETETTIHVSCDENCTLEYKKVVYTPKANGPARANSIVDDAADWTPLDGNTVEIEKINEDNHGKQFTFRAKHASGAVSDETAFAVNADGTTTGVESVEAEEADAPVEYFNLQGVRVMNPDKGLFIRRQGNRVEKVMMK
ncbi:MAG: chitobiase/beta-hexosaminidase C-terminal domain-containing protein [Bacteroidales bacterium]|nr:chitobiase/beta-hexosaminidase C-terminal domain-containing protein [Bacteroidales bacterium]